MAAPPGVLAVPPRTHATPPTFFPSPYARRPPTDLISLSGGPACPSGPGGLPRQPCPAPPSFPGCPQPRPALGLQDEHRLTWVEADVYVGLKGHLHDHFHASRSPSRTTKRFSHPNGEDPLTTSVSGHPDDLPWRWSSDTFDINGRAFESSENWAVLSIEGDKPVPHFDHAAAMVGSKMVVFGADSGQRLLDDTKILSLNKLTWDSVAPKVRPSLNGRSLKLRPCRGHCLVPWGKNVIFVGGRSDQPSDKISGVLDHLQDQIM